MKNYNLKMYIDDDLDVIALDLKDIETGEVLESSRVDNIPIMETDEFFDQIANHASGIWGMRLDSCGNESEYDERDESVTFEVKSS